MSVFQCWVRAVFILFEHHKFVLAAVQYVHYKCLICALSRSSDA